MNIVKLRTLDGPNVFHYDPVVVMTLDLEALHERESRTIPGFAERLLELVPGLHEHVCGKGYPGGFVERLRDGTYFGHVIEHVVMRSRVHPAVHHLLRGATAGVDALVRGECWDVDRLRCEARDIADQTDL